MDSINNPTLSQILADLIRRVLVRNGRFQHLISLILCFNFFLNANSIIVSVFHSYQPNFRCGELDVNHCNANGTCPAGYNFFTEEESIVSEWSLVCSRRLLAPTVNTLYFLGSMFTICFGGIADWFGKKRVLLFCVYMDVICFIGLSFATKLEWFIAIRIFQGFCNQVSVIVVYPLAMEYCPPKHRTILGLGFQLMWATGQIYLGVAAYSIKEDWRSLQLILAIPGLLTLAWSWIIPESIQWLCSKQKHDQAFQLLVKIAKRNGNYNEIEEKHRHWVENNKNIKSIKDVSHAEIDKDVTSFNSWHINRTIFRTSFLRKHLLIMSATWFTVTLSYYSVLFCMPALASDRHLNFLIGAVIEFCVYISMYFVISRFGRRKPMMIYFVVNGIILGLIGFLAAFPQNEWYIMTTTILSRGVSSSLYYGMELYTVELFPIVNQTFALGICVSVRQIGNMLAPMMLPIMLELAPMLPMAILGVLSFIIAFGYIFLPETLNIQIPASVEEAKVIWK